MLVLLRLSVALFVLIGLTEMTSSQQTSRGRDMLDAAERGDVEEAETPHCRRGAG